MNARLENLPTEVIHYLLDFLEYEEFCKPISRFFSALSSDPQFWQRKLKTDLALNLCLEDTKNYKFIYIKLSLFRKYKLPALCTKLCARKQSLANIFSSPTEKILVAETLQALLSSLNLKTILKDSTPVESFDLLNFLFDPYYKFDVQINIDTLKQIDIHLINYENSLDELLTEYFMYVFSHSSAENAVTSSTLKNYFNDILPLTKYLLGLLGLKNFLMKYLSGENVECHLMVFFSIAPTHFAQLCHYYINTTASPLNKSEQSKLKLFLNDLPYKPFIGRISMDEAQITAHDLRQMFCYPHEDEVLTFKFN